MAQLSLFEESVTGTTLPRDLLDYRPGIFSPEESHAYLKTFIHDIPWAQRIVQLYGRAVVTPRLTAFYADPTTLSSRSDQEKNPLPWTADLLAIKTRIDHLAGVDFNAVLLNYYRDGNDSVAWHTDNDGIPGRNRIVASVSFGQSRRFDIRQTSDHKQKFSVALASGSYLLMQGDFQDHWEHRIAKSTKPMQARVNLTFRIL
jgi:alkylated DNA repair dioxygenase AlkB